MRVWGSALGRGRVQYGARTSGVRRRKGVESGLESVDLGRKVGAFEC